MSTDSYQQILEGLKTHSSIKQDIFRATCEVFHDFKVALKDIAAKLNDDFNKVDPNVEITYFDINKFEAQIKFSGDVLIFTMHTNVFNFPIEHAVHRSIYVQADASNAYCGVIHIHNFLADSIQYNRVNDMGYLIGRVFINKEKRFFAEGKGQLSFLFTDIYKDTINRTFVDEIIKSAINYCFQFELEVPPFGDVDEMTLREKQLEFGNSGYQTGKMIGYKFRAEKEKKSPK